MHALSSLILWASICINSFILFPFRVVIVVIYFIRGGIIWLKSVNGVSNLLTFNEEYCFLASYFINGFYWRSKPIKRCQNWGIVQALYMKLIAGTGTCYLPIKCLQEESCKNGFQANQFLNWWPIWLQRKLKCFGTWFLKIVFKNIYFC